MIRIISVVMLLRKNVLFPFSFFFLLLLRVENQESYHGINAYGKKYKFLQGFLDKKATYKTNRSKGITLMPPGHHYTTTLHPSLSPGKLAPGLLNDLVAPILREYKAK